MGISKIIVVALSTIAWTLAFPMIAPTNSIYSQNLPTAKDALYQQFNANRRANPKEAYRIAQEYLKKYGGDADTSTGTIKEWVIAYEAVVGRVGGDASKPQASVPASPTINAASTTVYAPFTEINGTTWQVKGEENRKKWATIVSFSAGGRLQYENYAADGTSTLLKGTWRQLDSDIFGTLLGPDGNTIGTITGQSFNGVLEGILKWSEVPEWRFSLESESVPNLRKMAESKRWTQIESTQDAEEIRDYLFAFPNSRFASAAQSKLSELVANPQVNPISSPVKSGAWEPQAESKAWDVVAKSLNAADIQVYLSYFPSGTNSLRARKKMRSMDELEWQIAEKADSELGYAGYTEKNPYGTYAKAARERIASIKDSETEWVRIRASSNIEDFKIFLTKFQYGKNAVLAKERITPPAVGTMRLNSIGMKFMYVPAGAFMMGSKSYSDSRPVHQVTIGNGFWMGKYEVTQQQWELVMGNNPSHHQCGKDCPVDSVSWDNAKAFVAKLNDANDGFAYSLPTEAEWEYAARAGTTGDYYDNLDDIAWYDKNSRSTTHPVGQKKANSFGLHDMSGNVDELCEDYYQDNYKGLPTDGSANSTPGKKKWRIVRGGSRYAHDEYVFILSSVYRSFWVEGGARFSTGFRVAARPR